MGLLKKFFLFIIAALIILLSRPDTIQASPLAYPTVRLAGQDRIETALAIAQKGWTTAQTVILAEYSDFPDSIAATPFAVSLNAPILLTGGDSLDPRVVTELQQLKPQKVILLGGTGCLTPSIETALDKLSLKWERIGGADRYETSILLAKYITSDSLILANGDDFPDALSAATFAGIKQIPIVLTSQTFPASVIQYYNETKPKHLIVIGGEGVVPSGELTKNNFTVETRLGGQDRYETNAKVVSFMKDAYQSNDLFLASGLTFPDAVAGTVLASKLKAPLLLAEKDDIPPAVYSLMRGHMQVEPPASSTAGGNNTGNNSPTKQPLQGKITASGGLNLRETPTAAGKVLATVPQGATIQISTQQTGWYQTTYQGKTGWLSAGYVAVSSGAETTPAQTGNQTAGTSGSSNFTLNGKVTASGNLNLRDNPSATGKLLITIPQGAAIILMDHQNGWYKTTYQNKTGWVSDAYVSVVSQTGQITASGGLILRDAPSSTGKALLTIPAGSSVVITDLQGQWYKTTYQGQTGWISGSYVAAKAPAQAPLNSNSTASSDAQSPPASTSSQAGGNNSTSSIDLSVNGTVYILGGTGVISPNAENILEGKASSGYADNLKAFPPLPPEIKKPDPPQTGNTTTPPASNNPPVSSKYDPSKEVLLNPYAGIPANSLAGKTIVVDPGHGGPDTGAIGPSKTYEKNNTLPIALALADILKQEGAKVILTRDKDVSPAANYTEIDDLQARVDIANQSKADLFISIHNNSVKSNPDVQGTTTYFSQDNPKQEESLQLANSIQSAITGMVKTNDRGIKQAAFYVLKNTDMPAVLIEAAFISSPYEEARLQNSTFRQNLAASILKGIYNYYYNPPPKA